MEYSDSERLLIWLASIEGIGPKRYYALTTLYPDPLELWDALPSDTKITEVLGQRLKSTVLSRRYAENVDLLFEQMEKQNICAISESMYEYPQLLRDTVDAPPVLFVKGDVALLSSRCIGIVGSRRCTRYGREVAKTFGEGIASAGVTVVSGLARGVDTEAHTAALNATDGKTIAVLGCGVDTVYPPENRRLYEEIAQRGAIVSEYIMGTPPLPQHFPARNRIISGLSESIVLVEADEKSGALITVDYAIEQGREVYSVPGSIFSRSSRGVNRLIKNGSCVATEVADVLGNDYNSAQDATLFNNARKPIQLDMNEQLVINILQDGEASIDKIILQSGLSTPEVAGLLVMMEARRIIKKLPGGTYCIEGAEYC